MYLTTNQHKISIENMFLFENTSLNGKLFTSGNIDAYKEIISNKQTNELKFDKLKILCSNPTQIKPYRTL